MIKSFTFALALGLLSGGAAGADPITADPGTECQWPPEQRLGPTDCPTWPAASYAVQGRLQATPPGPTAPPDAPSRALFPEMNVRELCAGVGAAAAEYCEQRNWAAREQLVELWQNASERTREMCVQERPAPPHARYVTIVSCVQAQANVAWEARMKESGQWR